MYPLDIRNRNPHIEGMNKHTSASSSPPTMTVIEFFKKFPDDDSCLEHLFNIRFGQGHECPKCERASRWHRLTSEMAFSCQWCGHHIHPMAGTIFAKSRTPLQMWFYAIFLYTTTRNGVAAKELQRQLGVTYKCAWRIAHAIRAQMCAVGGETPIGGPGKTVQVDETYVGGVVREKGRGYKGNKTIVLGMIEEDGDAIAKVVPDVKKRTLHPIIEEHVEDGTHVETDELLSYGGLDRKGYTHSVVNHSAGEYVGRDGTNVNAVENFWKHLKAAIRSTHISVSHQHLEKYVKEFEFRFNRRMRPETMLDELLTRFPELQKS